MASTEPEQRSRRASDGPPESSSGPALVEALIILAGAGLLALGVLSFGSGVTAAIGGWIRGIASTDAGELLLVLNLLLAGALAWGIRRWHRMREALRDLSDLRQRYHTLFSMSPMAVALSKPNGTIQHVNRAWVRDLGYDRSDVLGRHVTSLELWADARDREQALDRLTEEGSLRRFPTVLRTGSGERREVEINADRLRLDGEEHVAWAVMDVTERNQYQRQLEEQALKDGLTGLANRSLLTERLSHTMERARRHGHPIGVLFVDLDGFKAVNDRHGHPAGDRVLREVARRMQSTVRGEDTVARLGGDEFVILLEDATREDVRKTADRVLSALSPPVPLEEEETEVTVGASIGVVRWRAEGSGGLASAGDLLGAADAAMYRVKSGDSGETDGIHVFSADEADPGVRRRRVERLRAAIEGDELVVHYQPVVDLRADRVAGAEALVRWQHPEHGLVPPGNFVGLAENAGLVRSLDERVLELAARQTSRWRADPGVTLPDDFRLAVNISPHGYDDARLTAPLMSRLREAGLPPDSLQVEVTERLALRETRPFRSLREHGVDLAVDDFGVGYSSLLYLRHLDADVLKVDRYFVQEVDEEERDSIILRSVLSIGQHLDVDVVAEGVETAEQRDHVRDLGFRLAQGYFFGRPVPAEEFGEALRASEALIPA